MMLEQIMFWAILGHFIGDYLMQSKKVALNKSAPGFRGAMTCCWHCLFYTCAVFLVVDLGLGRPTSPEFGLIIPVVFISHYPIDRWSLADKWLKWIKGRRLNDPAFQGYGNLIDNLLPEESPKLALRVLKDTATQQAFAAIVYTVVDNTMHIILMTAGFAALLHWEVI